MLPKIEITQPQYVREGLHYASDPTDAEWTSITSLYFADRFARGLERDPINGNHGLSVAAIAKGLPAPYSTVQSHIYG